MSDYQVLARKWRPQSFKDVVGQDHIIKALTHGIQTKRLHHAYLFTGTRGIGKTTFARIIARCLNCEQGPTTTPCGKCHACQSIPKGQFIDLIEIDAASRTKVEDTRELLETVHYAPSYGRYKIYLIDEVHMFSNHSFNALLKTLEEPPAHVIFILATTDPERLPMTILSRCLQFRLKALTTEQIHQHLTNILTQEKIPFKDDALNMLTHAAEGSMRDALSLLDQAIAIGQGTIESDTAATLLGSAPKEQLQRLVSNILASDIESTLETFEALKSLGVQAQILLKQISKTLCDLYKQVLLPDHPKSLTLPEDHIWHAQSKGERLTRLQLLYQIALIAQKDMAWAPEAFAHLEMTLLRMLTCRAQQPTSLAPKTNPMPGATPKTQAQPTTALKQNTSEIKTASPSTPELTQTINTPIEANTWPTILASLALSGMTKGLANQCRFHSANAHTIVLHAGSKEAAMMQDKHLGRISDALKQQGYPQKLVIEANDTMTPPTASSEMTAVVQSEKINQLKVALGASVVQSAKRACKPEVENT